MADAPGGLVTWLAVAALVANYGTRAVVPVVAHVLCRTSDCDAAGLIGSVASAFFIGDLLAQVAAKPMVRRLGGKRLLSIGTAGIAGSLVLVTLLVDGAAPLFLGAQGILGFCCGLGYPASHALIAEAVPASRRATAVSLIVSASAVGTMLSNLATPLLVGYLGWQSPFVLFVAASATAALVVEALCPSSTNLASPEAAAQQQEVKATGAAGELRRWLLDPLVEAMIFAMYASGVANAFLYSFIPTLFVEAYHVKLADLAWLTTAAPLVNAAVCVISGVVADALVGQHGWAPHRCRAFMQLLGTLLPCGSLLALALGVARGSAAGAATLVTIWFAAHGFQTAGLTATFHDVGKLRASELFAVGNVFSKIAGVLAGHFFSRLARARSWEAVLLVIAGHYLISGIVFVAFVGRSERTRRLIIPTEAEAEEQQALPRAPESADATLLKTPSQKAKRRSLGVSIGATIMEDLGVRPHDLPRNSDDQGLQNMTFDMEYNQMKVWEAALLKKVEPQGGIRQRGHTRSPEQVAS